MEVGPRIITFDPLVDHVWTSFMTKTHLLENSLLEDCVRLEFIVGETEKGEPIFAKAEDELGPESRNEVEEKVQKYAVELPDLKRAYLSCGGKDSNFSFRLPSDSIDFFGDASPIDNYF